MQQKTIKKIIDNCIINETTYEDVLNMEKELTEFLVKNKSTDTMFRYLHNVTTFRLSELSNQLLERKEYANIQNKKKRH